MSKITIILSLLFLLTACSKKGGDNPTPASITLDATDVSLHYDETHQFSLKQGNNNISASAYTWTSSDVNIGTVDANGAFTAKKIGTTTIRATKGGDAFESQVTVVPYSTICKEPYWDFSDNISSTKGKETRTLASQTSTGLIYTGENDKVRNIMYLYDATSGKMTAAAILFTNTTAVVDESSKFFKERYTYVGVSGSVYYYTDSKSLVIAISVDASLGYNAIYMPYTSSAINSINVKNSLNELKKQNRLIQ